MDANPDATNSEIRAMALKSGFFASQISSNLVANVRRRWKGKKPGVKNGAFGRRKTANVQVVPPSSPGDNAGYLKFEMHRAVEFIRQCGGIEQAKEQIDLFEQLKALIISL